MLSDVIDICAAFTVAAFTLIGVSAAVGLAVAMFGGWGFLSLIPLVPFAFAIVGCMWEVIFD